MLAVAAVATASRGNGGNLPFYCKTAPSGAPSGATSPIRRHRPWSKLSHRRLTCGGSRGRYCPRLTDVRMQKPAEMQSSSPKCSNLAPVR